MVDGSVHCTGGPTVCRFRSQLRQQPLPVSLASAWWTQCLVLCLMRWKSWVLTVRYRCAHLKEPTAVKHCPGHFPQEFYQWFFFFFFRWVMWWSQLVCLRESGLNLACEDSQVRPSTHTHTPHTKWVSVGDASDLASCWLMVCQWHLILALLLVQQSEVQMLENSKLFFF